MSEEQRYAKLEQEKQNALNTSNQTYQELYDKNTEYSNSFNNYLKEYQNTQNDIYDKQTAFQVDLQNQNKEKAEKEFNQEAIASKNAYYDYINPYGANREIQAQNGLNNSGYSESNKTQAWTTQQNRTAQARASMNEAKLQFDNAIKEAYLTNDVNKANLALQILQQKQDEMLRSFNYISDTKQNQLSNNQNLDKEYNNRYNTLYSQIQEEKATAEAIRQWEAEMAEKQRQYNETMAFQKQQAQQEQANWEKQYALSKKGGNNDNPLISYPLTETIKTDYYSGPINPDVHNGTFNTQDKNGVYYQPNNIGGEPLKSTRKTVSQTTGMSNNKNSSGVNVDNQKVWQLPNGTTWIWNGSKNEYEQVRFD